MTNPNFRKTTTIDLSSVADWSVDDKLTDGEHGQELKKWTNTNSSKNYGFYYGVGEFRSAVNASATWTIGQGYTAESARDKVILDSIRGAGEDTFLSILWNHLVTMSFNGDAYAEIIRNKDTGTLLNLKPLDPRRVNHYTNKQGIIVKYGYMQGDGKERMINPNMMFHSMNNRVLDEPHGTSDTSAVEWVIEKIMQAREDYARLMHITSIRIFYVDENDTARQNIIKTQYKDAIENKHVMMITCKPEEARFEDLAPPPADTWLRWLGYLEDKFYKQLGVPKIVLGGTADNTEASAKVGVVIYEPVWTRRIMELESDIWNQLGIKFKINKQPSMMDGLQQQEQKNQAQTGFQPNDTQVNIEGER